MIVILNNDLTNLSSLIVCPLLMTVHCTVMIKIMIILIYFIYYCRKAQWMREDRAATKIQSQFRMYRYRKLYLSLREACLHIQSYYRGMKGNTVVTFASQKLYVWVMFCYFLKLPKLGSLETKF